MNAEAMLVRAQEIQGEAAHLMAESSGEGFAYEKGRWDAATAILKATDLGSLGCEVFPIINPADPFGPPLLIETDPDPEGEQRG